MMRTILVIGLALTATAADAQTHVHGYTTRNGTYVAPYVRTNPNNTIYDNYSTRPNVNPYTGQEGTVNPYAPSSIYHAPSPGPQVRRLLPGLSGGYTAP